jgi:hypothetical protein
MYLLPLIADNNYLIPREYDSRDPEKISLTDNQAFQP